MSSSSESESNTEGSSRSSSPERTRDEIPLNVFHSDGVSALNNNCQVDQARELVIYEIASKLVCEEEYDIGGVYSGTDPLFWFYFTTSHCAGRKYLFNLYVCHRTIGNFSIGHPVSNECSRNEISKHEIEHTMIGDLKWSTFKSAPPDENYYITTICFDENDLRRFEFSTLIIPILIKTDIEIGLCQDFLHKIRLQHNVGILLLDEDMADFELQSVEGNKFKVHKAVLGAHSPILREHIIHHTNYKIDINNESVKALVEFLYTGAIKDARKIDWNVLLVTGRTLKLDNLIKLAQFHIST